MIELNDEVIETDLTTIPRKDVVLLFLTIIPGAIFSPVQLQKGLFLISKNLPDLFDINYSFMPASYGPYDGNVYEDVEQLEREKLVKSFKDNYIKRYVATPVAFEYVRDKQLKSKISEKQDCYIWQVVNWILSKSMSQIVGSIVRNYPEYGTQMIFKN